MDVLLMPTGKSKNANTKPIKVISNYSKMRLNEKIHLKKKIACNTNIMYSRQKAYLKSDKGKLALKKYRDKPDNKAKQKLYQKLYQETYKDTKRYNAKMNYYYSTDPLPCIRKLYCSV